MISSLLNDLRQWVSTHRKQALIISFLSISAFAGVSLFYSSKQVRSARLMQRPETVVGKIVTLRKLKEEYFIDYHNMFSQTVRRGLEYPDEITLDYTIRHLRYEMKRDANKEILQYCIFDNKENKLIGSLEIREKNDRDPGQFGCWVNERYWGGGRFQEAVDLITQTYFALSDAPSYNAHVRLWNKRSYAALKRFGFKDVGFYYENGLATRYLLEYHRP